MMTASAYWEAARKLPVAELATVVAGRALVLAPHPDDESLGCGGLIAEACARGVPPLVVILTDGTGSHPNSPTYPAERLRLLREAETVQALACLGLTAECVVTLGYRDTEAPRDGRALAIAADRVAYLMGQYGCGTILAPSRHDPHGDHIAAHLVAQRAAQQAGALHRAYPVWGLTLPPMQMLDDIPRGMRLPIGRHRTAKRQAIRCHRSQYSGLITDDPAGFQMSYDFVTLFDADYELYLDPS